MKGVFGAVVARVDYLFVKTTAPYPKEVKKVLLLRSKVGVLHQRADDVQC